MLAPVGAWPVHCAPLGWQFWAQPFTGRAEQDLKARIPEEGVSTTLTSCLHVKAPAVPPGLDFDGQQVSLKVSHSDSQVLGLGLRFSASTAWGSREL